MNSLVVKVKRGISESHQRDSTLAGVFPFKLSFMNAFMAR